MSAASKRVSQPKRLAAPTLPSWIRAPKGHEYWTGFSRSKSNELVKDRIVAFQFGTWARKRHSPFQLNVAFIDGRRAESGLTNESAGRGRREQNTVAVEHRGVVNNSPTPASIQSRRPWCRLHERCLLVEVRKYENLADSGRSTPLDGSPWTLRRRRRLRVTGAGTNSTLPQFVRDHHRPNACNWFLPCPLSRIRIPIETQTKSSIF